MGEKIHGLYILHLLKYVNISIEKSRRIYSKLFTQGHGNKIRMKGDRYFVVLIYRYLRICNIYFFQ